MSELWETADLEDQILSALPRRLEMEPRLRQDVLRALQKTADLPPKLPTFEAFIEWVDEDVSAEWINGDVIFMSPVSLQHQLIVGFLNLVVGLFVEKQGLGVVVTAPFKMKLKNYGPEPDLLFVAGNNKKRLKETYLNGPADMVVEVISPESIGRDRGEKFLAYEEAGIPEYWLLDPAREQAEFYQLDANGRYQLIPIDANGRYQSRILPGLWLQTSWLWAVPLPSTVDILRQLNIIN